MKKLLVCLTIGAAATMTSLQAGECATKDKAACATQAKTAPVSLEVGECAKEKAACSTQAKTAPVSLQVGECAKEKTVSLTEVKADCSTQTAAKSCCATGKVAKKRVNTTAKGATLLVRR